MVAYGSRRCVVGKRGSGVEVRKPSSVTGTVNRWIEREGGAIGKKANVQCQLSNCKWHE